VLGEKEKGNRGDLDMTALTGVDLELHGGDFV
jgi:hypothetical protein